MSAKLTRFSVLAVLVAALSGVSAAQAAVEVAKVGTKAITDQDVKSAVAGMPDFQKQQINKEPDAKLRLVNNLVIEELFVQEAEKSGVANDKDFKTALERARRQLLSQRFLQKNVQPKITDAAVKSHFEKNKTRYSTDEVRAYHVLLKSENEAKEVAEKAKKGEDFEVLAKKYSKDPSAAQNGGDLGYFTRSRMVPAFADAAFAMKKGDISGPVKSPFGFHVIKVVDKRDGKPVKFDDIKEQVKEEFQNATVTQFVDDLKKKNNVVINEEKAKGVAL